MPSSTEPFHQPHYVHFIEEKNLGHRAHDSRRKGEWAHSAQEVLKSLPKAHDSIIQFSVHSPASHLFLPWPIILSRTSYLCLAGANPTPLGFAFMLGSEQLPSKGCLCSMSVSSSARITSSEKKSRVKVLPDGFSRGYRCVPQVPHSILDFCC